MVLSRIGHMYDSQVIEFVSEVLYKLGCHRRQCLIYMLLLMFDIYAIVNVCYICYC